jgi:hypothetical protein
VHKRISRLIAIFGVLCALTACSHLPPVPDSMHADGRRHLDDLLRVPEPAPTELVIVINYNTPWGVHAGMFTGNFLNDPSGGYRARRRLFRDDWREPSLSDYVRFQMEEDGNHVVLYRFILTREAFEAIDRNARNSGRGAPLFCAADVYKTFAGLHPFETLSSRWWLSPAALAERLDALTQGPDAIGRCQWPNGAPCWPSESTAKN